MDTGFVTQSASIWETRSALSCGPYNHLRASWVGATHGPTNCIDDGPLVSYTDLVRCLEAMEIEAGGRIERGQIRYALVHTLCVTRGCLNNLSVLEIWSTTNRRLLSRLGP